MKSTTKDRRVVIDGYTIWSVNPHDPVFCRDAIPHTVGAIGGVGDMVIEKAEIERIVDDLQTKADEAHRYAETLYKKGEYLLAASYDRHAHGFEYGVARLRELL